MGPVKCQYYDSVNTSEDKSTFAFPINDVPRLQLWIQNAAVEHVKMVATLCKECEKPIKGFGFQWWCLQCGGLRCGLCVMRRVHRQHLILRSPANTTPEQIKILIAAIQKEMQLGDFVNTRDADGYVDNVESEDMDPDVIEESLQEPTVKAEPPEEAEDPLAECSNINSILKPVRSQTKGYPLPIDRKSNSQNCRPNQNSSLDSFNTHNENSSDLPLRDIVCLGDTDYPPREKSLRLDNPFKHQRNLQYVGLKKSRIEDIIDYRPSKKSICLNLPTVLSLDSQGWIDYKPSKKSVCHESINPSQTSKGLDNSEHRPKFLELDDFSGNFGLCSYDRPDIDDIRYSISLQTAPKGPERIPTPDPTSTELSGSCCWAMDRVPNADTTNMEFAGSYSLATDAVPSPEPRSMELSGSGYESDRSSVQLETLVRKDHNPRDEDPPCSKRIRLQSCPDNIDDLVNATVARAPPIRNISQQPTEITANEPNCTKIIYEPKFNKTVPPLSELQKQTVDHIPQIQTQIKQNCEDTIALKNGHNKQKSVNTLGKPKNTLNTLRHTQKPKIYATYTKQTNNSALQKKKMAERNSVKNLVDPNNDPLKTQLPEIPVDTTHEDKNSTDTTKEQKNKSESLQQPIKVYSKKRSFNNIIEQKDKLLKPINNIKDSQNDPIKIMEPQIRIHSAHEKQYCKDITELKDDNSTTQEQQMQVYSSHKKRNCTEHKTTSKTRISIGMNFTHKQINPMGTTEQNDNSNKVHETQIQVYSTHKAKNRERCRTRKYS